MNRRLLPVLLLAGQLLAQICAAQNHANTIERDKDNPCIIRITVHIGVIGTDADVTAIQNDLNACFSQECFIPCETDAKKGCKVVMKAIVKRWNSLTEQEKDNYHQVNMLDNDGLPSNAMIGKANEGASMGDWRRNEPPHTYCHETLHFLGLPDQYCDRRFNPIDSTIIISRNCTPPPDPNGGNCCSPTITDTRCTVPCEGHNDDLMATLFPSLSCKNILDVLAIPGFNSCPEACCTSSTAFHSDEFFVAPSYFHFGDKEDKFGAYGGTLEYTHWTSAKLGLTLDLGYYTNTKKEDDFKQNNNIFTITAGVTYIPGVFGKDSKLDLYTHGFVGMVNYKTKVDLAGVGESKISKGGFTFNLGAALNYEVNKKIDWRILQADYIPTFFFNNTQNNYRLSTGLTLKWGD